MIKGKLVDEHGNPVPSASAALGGKSSFTGADGGFELSTEGMEPGTHAVISGHKYDQAAYLSYASSSANIEITLAGTPWWQYVVAFFIFLIILALIIKSRGALGKIRRRIKYPRG